MEIKPDPKLHTGLKHLTPDQTMQNLLSSLLGSVILGEQCSIVKAAFLVSFDRLGETNLVENSIDILLSYEIVKVNVYLHISTIHF